VILSLLAVVVLVGMITATSGVEIHDQPAEAEDGWGPAPPSARSRGPPDDEISVAGCRGRPARPLVPIHQ
jgi:hypothetical protein